MTSPKRESHRRTRRGSHSQIRVGHPDPGPARQHSSAPNTSMTKPAEMCVPALEPRHERVHDAAIPALGVSEGWNLWAPASNFKRCDAFRVPRAVARDETSWDRG